MGAAVRHAADPYGRSLIQMKSRGQRWIAQRPATILWDVLLATAILLTLALPPLQFAPPTGDGLEERSAHAQAAPAPGDVVGRLGLELLAGAATEGLVILTAVGAFQVIEGLDRSDEICVACFAVPFVFFAGAYLALPPLAVTLLASSGHVDAMTYFWTMVAGAAGLLVATKLQESRADEATTWTTAVALPVVLEVLAAEILRKP